MLGSIWASGITLKPDEGVLDMLRRLVAAVEAARPATDFAVLRDAMRGANPRVFARLNAQPAKDTEAVSDPAAMAESTSPRPAVARQVSPRDAEGFLELLSALDAELLDERPGPALAAVEERAELWGPEQLLPLIELLAREASYWSRSKPSEVAKLYAALVGVPLLGLAAAL